MLGAILSLSGAPAKALSFLTILIWGYLLGPRFSKDEKNGVQKVIMLSMLPAVIFKGLVGITITRDQIVLPAIGAAYVVWQLLTGHAIGFFLFPSRELQSPRRTVAFSCSTFAPGLSSFVFITQFVSESAAGTAAFVDLANKLYLLVLLAPLLRMRRNRLPDSKELTASKPVPNSTAPAMWSWLTQLIGDPINLAILVGGIMSISGAPVQQLGFIGEAISKLASAQSAALFFLIGLKLKLQGSTFAVCIIALCARASAALAFVAVVSRLLQLDMGMKLMATLLSQAAVSVIGWGQMNKVSREESAEFAFSKPWTEGSANENGKNRPEASFNVELAFDLVGYSFPFTVFFNTVACVFPETYTSHLPELSAALATVAAMLLLLFRHAFQDPAQWKLPLLPPSPAARKLKGS